MNTKSLKILCCAFAGLFTVEHAAADHTIYRDDFSKTRLLNGSLPDTGVAPWNASGNWSIDGTHAVVAAPASLALLPFKPRPGNRYTLSVRMHCTNANPVYEWMALGFADGLHVDGAWHTTNNPSGWMLMRYQSGASNQLQTFPGGDAGVFSGEHVLSIILDTSPSSRGDWSVECKVDGNTVSGPRMFGGNGPTISSVGIGNGSGIGWVDEFSITSLIDDSLANLADGIRSVSPPARGAALLAWPALPVGYHLTLKSSSAPEVIATNGKIVPPAASMVVNLVFAVVRDSDGASADTISIPVYVPAIRPKEPYRTYADNFRLRQGLFITWTGTPDGTGNFIVFRDGTRATTMDQFADRADVNAIADQVKAFGFDHVVLMDFHGTGTTLHPCAALDAWRGPGFTSKRDLIGEQIAAFRARGIKTYLFTHPLDGHDYSPDQQKLLGFNDPANGYRRWNDFINDVYAEIVERYGDDIVGLGFDSEFGMSGNPLWAGKLDLPRLRATILSRRPGLSLTALAGPNDTCELGLKEIWRPSWLDPWNSRAETDYNIENWPAYRRVPAIVQGFHWATINPPEGGLARLSGRQMFRYTVLQAAASTEGPGVQWAASPYTDGSWENGVAEAFADLGARVQAVRESLRGVSPSTAYPVNEGVFLSNLPNGIAATRSLGGTLEYLHVLNPPASRTLALPVPADGVRYLAARLLSGGNSMPLQQSASGVSVTLPNGVNWDEADTVICLDISPASLPQPDFARDRYVAASDSVEDAGMSHRVPWGLRNLVDGITTARSQPASWSVGNFGWSSKTTLSNRPVWLEVDLGSGFLLDNIRLHPRDDGGNVGMGFPVDFRILISGDGNSWNVVADIRGLALPATTQSYPFTASVARYVRVEATQLRSNPADGGRYAMQFAELEAFGPKQPFKAQSSLNPAAGFMDASDAVVDLSRYLMTAPVTGPSRFFRLNGNPPPDIVACRIDSGSFIVEIAPVH